MKNFINYLSKKSLSLENGSRLVRDRFEIGSAKSRKSLGPNLSRFSLASLICVLMLTLGVGNAWGDPQTWNLAQASYASADASTVTWSSSYVTMVVTRNGDANTAVNNYLGGSGTNTNTRFYSGNKITFTPQSGYTVSSVSITCTTNYSSGFGSTWTNASQSTSSDVVTITPTNGENAFYCVISAQVRVTSVVVTYSSAAPATPYTVTFTKTDGSTTALTEESAGAGVTPPAMQATCGDWSFQGWSKSYSNSTTSTTVLSTVTLTTGKYYPSENTTLYPVYTKSGGTAFSQYQLITSASGDLSGKYLLSTGTITATGAVVSSKALPYESLTPGTTQYAAKEFTIVKNGNNSNYFIKFPNGYYLGNSNSSTDLKTNGSTSAPTTDVNHFLWTFTTSKITNVNNTDRDLMYNSTAQTPVIKCYANSNTYPKIKLYKRIETEITYYYSYPSCCEELASINGSFCCTAI